MKYSGMPWDSNVPRNCYRRIISSYKYYPGDGVLSLSIPSACLQTNRISKMIYRCDGINYEGEIDDASKALFDNFVIFFRGLHDNYCFKRLIVPCDYQLFVILKCAGWDLRELILRVGRDCLESRAALDKSKMPGIDKSLNGNNSKIVGMYEDNSNVLARGLHRLLRDINNLFGYHDKPIPPFAITFDEPLWAGNREQIHPIDLSALWSFIIQMREMHNPYYYSDSGSMTLDISDFEIRNYLECSDYIVYNKYDINWGSFGHWFGHTEDQRDAWKAWKNDYGNRMRGAYIDLIKDSGEYNQLLPAANALGLTEIWVFPGEDVWWSKQNNPCSLFLYYCAELCKRALNYGFSRDKTPIEVKNTVFKYCRKYPQCHLCINEDDHLLRGALYS